MLCKCDEVDICKTMSRYSTGFTEAIQELSPDCLVLGDGYEFYRFVQWHI